MPGIPAGAPDKEKGRCFHRPSSHRLTTGRSAFGRRRLAHSAALIDLGDTAADIHEAATVVGIGLGAAMLNLPRISTPGAPSKEKSSTVTNGCGWVSFGIRKWVSFTFRSTSIPRSHIH
jgi:hypothetical protein